MENAMWLFVVAGGAAILGLALAFGIIKQNPARGIGAIAGAVIVAIGAVGLGYLVSSQTETAPSKPSDAQGSQFEAPARPSDQNALPGLNQQNR